MNNKPTVQIKKILLLNPFMFNAKNKNVGIDPVVSRHAGQEIKTGVTFPIGLAYLAAVLLKAGYEARILDPLAEDISVDKIYSFSEWAGAIVMPYSPFHKEDTGKYLHDFRGKLRILCGSIAGHVYDFLFKNDFCDVILKGEPEETIVDLVKQYPNLNSVKGIIVRSDSGKAIINESRDPVQDLDGLPFPARDFSSPANYWDISFFGKPTAWILPTRGCPFDCIFCAQHDLNKKKVRRRSPKNIVDEIEQVTKEQKVTNFVFFDETFNLDPEYAISVCDEILKRGLDIKWWCAGRPDRVREDVVRKMKASGCIEMRFGLESANDEILEYLGKGTTVEKIRRGIEITDKSGMNFSLQCIIGSPMESKKTLRNTLKFIREVRPLFVSFNVLTPLPGSRLFDEIKDKIAVEEGLGNFDILHTDFPLGKFTSKELAAIIKKVYIGYYFSFGFMTKIGRECIKNPEMFSWIIKTLFVQAGYIFKSILARK